MTGDVIDFPKGRRPNCRGLDALCGDSKAVAEAEARDMAALDFEPVDNIGLIADLTEPAWSEMVNGLGVTLRLSALTVGKTKAGLVDLVRKLRKDGGDDALFETIDSLADGAKHLKSLAEIAEAASIRMLAAASVIAADAPDDGSAAFSDREALIDAFLGGLRALLLAAPMAEGCAPPPVPDRDGRTLRVKDVAEHYRVTAKSVYEWANVGMLPALRLPGRDGAGSYRFRDADLAEFDRRRERNWTPPEPVVLTAAAGQAVPIGAPKDAFRRGQRAVRACARV